MSEPLERVFRPPQCCERQSRELTNKLRKPEDPECLVGTCGHERGKRCWRERQSGFQSQEGAFIRQGAAQAFHTLEEMQAALDLEEKPVRRSEAYTRRKTLRTDREPLEVWDVCRKVHADPKLRRRDDRRAGHHVARPQRAAQSVRFVAGQHSD